VGYFKEEVGDSKTAQQIFNAKEDGERGGGITRPENKKKPFWGNKAKLENKGGGGGRLHQQF